VSAKCCHGEVHCAVLVMLMQLQRPASCRRCRRSSPSVISYNDISHSCWFVLPSSLEGNHNDRLNHNEINITSYFMLKSSQINVLSGHR